MAEASPAHTTPRRHRLLIAMGVLVVVVALVVIFWDWNWFRPLVEREASTELGREVTLRHFDLHPGRRTVAVADGVQIANAPGFGDEPFVSINRLSVSLDVMQYMRHGTLVIPDIGIDAPQVDAREKPDGSNNYTFSGLSGGGSNSGMKLGNLRISNGKAHVVLAKLRTDMTMAVHTRPLSQAGSGTAGSGTFGSGKAGGSTTKSEAGTNSGTQTGAASSSAAPPATTTDPTTQSGTAVSGAAASGSQDDTQSDVVQTAAGQVIADIKGTYAGQPISGEFTGGELLSLRDAKTPYPINLRLQNGPTRVSMVGTVQNPMNFAGANVKLEFSGTDMELLLPITGIAFPKTPSYRITGNLDYADGKIRFRNFAGKVGSSDMEGDIDVDPRPARPVMTADVHSNLLDLADLGGFVGSEPGRMSTPNQTPEQKAALARAEASPRLLPTTTISLPKLKAADVHLKYRGAKILGRNMPFDSFAADMDIVDGNITLHPITLGVGEGRITGNIELTPISETEFHTKADVAVQRVDLGRLLSATHLVKGSGVIGGRATLDTTGNSTATMLGNGNGSLQLTMAGGGTLSALIVNLSGLEFGNALLSALGVPDRDEIQCFVSDFALEHGTLDTRTLLLDTTNNIVNGTGSVDLRTETVNYELKTQSKHFSIGTLPTPIDITGTLKGPHIMPAIGPLAARGGAAVALGILFPPAALIPTIQFGVGDDNRCAEFSKRAAK